MKIFLRDLVTSIDSLKELATLKFKAAKAFQIAKFIKAVESELQDYESIRVETVKKYSSDGKAVDNDKIVDFGNELNELLSKVVEVPDCNISESDLESFELSASLLVQLQWLIAKE